MKKSYKNFDVQASAFRLGEGDKVGPETEIGFHFETGQPVMAGCSGTVKTVGFNSANHSLVVSIEVDEG